MNRLLLGCVALTLTAGFAGAADLPTKAPIYKAPVATTYDWTGFYLGGYWGTAIGQSGVSTPAGPFDPVGRVDISKNGWTAGGTIGANWQANSNWLIGIEGDLGYLGNDRTFGEWDDPAVTAGVKTSWYATVRGRVGYVTGPSLLYLTGGAAFVRLEDVFGGCGTVFCAVITAPTSITTTKTGWTAGGGIETRLSRNWTQKTEYLYVDAGVTDFLSVPYTTPQQASFRNQFHLIKTGLNYKFGGPAEPMPFFGGALLPTDHNWAGFYAGANIGGGLTTSPAPINFPGAIASQNENDMRGNGFAGGVQAGYNFMNVLGRASWFAGVEGDVGYLGIRASHVDWNDVFQMTQKTNWYGTARVRVGTTTGPALLYVTGGAAFVQVENGFGSSLTPAQIQALAPGSTISTDVRSETRAGWTFGGGTEVALDAHWSARLEYLYIDAGKSNRISQLNFPPAAPFSIGNDFSNRFHVVRAGLNYSFNAPVVAKY